MSLRGTKPTWRAWSAMSGVCTESSNPDVVVMKSAKEGV